MRNSIFKDILANIKESKTEPLHLHSKVLIIDAMNTFLRSFAMINHMNPNGHHIGGLTGFLKSIGYAIRHVEPTRVIIVFDGAGSITNKKNLYPEYKANRKLQRITNWDGFEDREDESESIINQMLRLVEYLKCLPVTLISIDKVEADDVIGYLTTNLPNEVTIMSADRDFLQLVNDRVTVYSPTKKVFYTPRKVKEEYDIYPQNFLTHKIIVGDSSDNVPGVNRIQLKTLLKLYPALKEETPITLNEILEEAKDKDKRYADIYNFRNQLQINKQLMDLKNPNLPESDIEVIQYILNNPEYNFNKHKFIKMYNEDVLGESIPNVEFWFQDVFHYLTVYKLN